MLAYLGLKNVGPAPSMEMDLGSRMNLMTGDNGLGKTLLLDAAWYALTRTWPFLWPGKGLVPTVEPARISWQERRNKNQQSVHSALYSFKEGMWLPDAADGPESADPSKTLVVYGRVDGGFSVTIPYRLGHPFRLPFGQEAWDRSMCFQFDATEVWEGSKAEVNQSSYRVNEGLLRDWRNWATDPSSESFDQFTSIVKALSPGEELIPLRKWERIFIDDALDVPILQTPAGEVPIVHTSAAVKRMLGLAYMLVWVWREHRIAARLQKLEPLRSFVLLIDEVEAHLHPQWQRRIVPALMAAHQALAPDVAMQIFLTTHSPLVLASAEPCFDPGQDAWFDLDFEREPAPPHVVLRKRPFVKHGDVSNWLTSNAFDLKSARSLEAERAMEQAKQLLREPNPNLEQAEQIHQELAKVLPDIDPFWVRWGAFMEKLRGNA